MTDVLPTNSNSRCRATKPRGFAWWKFVLLLALIPAVYFGSTRLWTRVIRDYIYPRNFGVVEPGRIFRSGLISHRIIRQTLQDNHVALVLHMSGDDPKSYDSNFEHDVCEELHIRRLNYNLAGDGTGNPKFYVNALAELAAADKAGTPVLVHCKTGAQRTGGMVLLYRVLIEGKPEKQAYAELLRYGHDPAKNTQLVPYLNQHMHEIAQGLVDKGVIPQVPSPLPIVEP